MVITIVLWLKNNPIQDQFTKSSSLIHHRLSSLVPFSIFQKRINLKTLFFVYFVGYLFLNNNSLFNKKRTPQCLPITLTLSFSLSLDSTNVRSISRSFEEMRSIISCYFWPPTLIYFLCEIIPKVISLN